MSKEFEPISNDYEYKLLIGQEEDPELHPLDDDDVHDTELWTNEFIRIEFTK